VMFWLAVVGVVAFSWGFAAGATHEQYKPITAHPASEREARSVMFRANAQKRAAEFMRSYTGKRFPHQRRG
jgi:hypothetical protein